MGIARIMFWRGIKFTWHASSISNLTLKALKIIKSLLLSDFRGYIYQFVHTSGIISQVLSERIQQQCN